MAMRRFSSTGSHKSALRCRCCGGASDEAHPKRVVKHNVLADSPRYLSREALCERFQTRQVKR